MKNVLLLFAGAALTSCQTTGPVAETRVVDTRKAMIDGINPAAAAIWHVTNNAMDDVGGLDAARMNDDAWSGLEEAARSLEFHSQQMAAADVIRAGGPDIVGDMPAGVASKAEIQAMIDGDPEGFRDISRTMAEHARSLFVAARARNVEAAGELASRIDEPCQSCHVRYWYSQ